MTFQALSFVTLCEFFVICLTATTVKTKAVSGPYTVTAVGLRTCDKPSGPYVKDLSLKVATEMDTFKKKGIIKGNITVFKDTKNIKTTVKEYYYEDGKWQLTFQVKGLSCRSQLIADLMESIDIIYDKKTCAVPKGTYSFEVNYNKMDHLWMASRDYGRMLRRIEVFDNNKTIYCSEFETAVGPQKH